MVKRIENMIENLKAKTKQGHKLVRYVGTAYLSICLLLSV